MGYMLDPNKETLIWGPAPVTSTLAYAACLKGCFVDFPKLFAGYSWPKAIIVWEKGARLVWMHEADEMRVHAGALFMDRMLPKDLREKARTEWKAACADLRAYEQEIKETDLAALSDVDLLDKWRVFHEKVDTFWAHSSLPELSNFGSTEILESKIKEVVPEAEIGSVMEVLTAPEGLSFYQEEEIDLSETDDVAKHQREYFWLANSYVNVEVLPVEYFEKRKAEFARRYARERHETS